MNSSSARLPPLKGSRHQAHRDFAFWFLIKDGKTTGWFGRAVSLESRVEVRKGSKQVQNGPSFLRQSGSQFPSSPVTGSMSTFGRRFLDQLSYEFSERLWTKKKELFLTYIQNSQWHIRYLSLSRKYLLESLNSRRFVASRVLALNRERGEESCTF